MISARITTKLQFASPKVINGGFATSPPSVIPTKVGIQSIKHIESKKRKHQRFVQT